MKGSGKAFSEASWSLAPLPPPLYQGQTIFTSEKPIGLWGKAEPRPWRMGVVLYHILQALAP